MSCGAKQRREQDASEKQRPVLAGRCASPDHLRHLRVVDQPAGMELPGTGGDALDDLVAEHEEHDGDTSAAPGGRQVDHPARDQVGPDLRRHPERRPDTAHGDEGGGPASTRSPASTVASSSPGAAVEPR